MTKYRFIVIGAGFSGSVIAERIASVLGEKVLIIEKREHIGGNCYDFKNEHGINVHKYGPHLFHTDDDEVFRYISQFTDWHFYEHKPLAYVDGKKIPIPVNFHTIDLVFEPKKAELFKEKLIRNFGENRKVPILELMKNNDEDLKELADWVYQKIFVNYTSKQWGKKPQEIDPSVTARVPVYSGYDSRYFHDKYQFIPLNGYTEVFKNMLSNSLIELKLNTDFKELIKIDFKLKKIYFKGLEFNGYLIFTGMIDELCEFRFGRLPYRSLNFDFKDYDKEYFQESAIVNYPNDYDYTRITEFKHIHPIKAQKTTVAYEYPKNHTDDDIPYYPFFAKDAVNLYLKYQEFLKDFDKIILLGRLAEYKYYDMDDAIKRALQVFNENVKR